MKRPSAEIVSTGNASAWLALCQVHTEQWDLDGNRERTLAALDEAAAGGAELAVTPECVLNGYGHPETPEDEARLRECAETIEGPAVRCVRESARRHGMRVLLGFVEAGAAGRLHNSAALIGPDGGVLQVYRKVHLRSFESIEHAGCFTPGETFETRTLKLARARVNVGTLICFDRELPESVRCLRSQGAELILCPLATDTWDLSRPEAYMENETLTRCRAAENEVFIAVVNHAGRFNGGSFVVGPGGEVLCQLGCAPEVRVIDLPVGAIEQRFHSRPLGWMGWGYRRPDVYREYL